jgi:hypothetical protein
MGKRVGLRSGTLREVQSIGKARKKIKDDLRGEVSSDERNDSIDVDVLDQIESHVGALSEIVQLLHAASLQSEAWSNVSLDHIAEDMLHRLREIKELSWQLRDHCRRTG